MYPHERSLVKKLEGKPFVILGVNSDTDRAEIKKVIEKEEITWRSFWNDGTGGPISTKWNVRGWPTVYILDPKGVIRYKSVGANEKAIDATIEKLLKETEAGTK
jgi:Thioredoxin-like